MQKHFLKIIPLIFVMSIALQTQGQSNELSRADSLFQKKRYTQSFEIYKSIFDRGRAD
jgi:hypothetical protein